MTSTQRQCTTCGNPNCSTLDHRLMCGDYTNWEPKKATVQKPPALISESFEGLPVVFREDGYLNVTAATKHYKRKAIDFLRLPGTDAYLTALADALKVEKSHLWISKKGRYGGTLLHPKLAVFFARWLDVRFAVWCDLMIDNILKGHIQTTVAVPTQEAIDVNSVVAPLRAKILALEDELKAVRAGEVPPDWKTAKVFLVEAGMSNAAAYKRRVRNSKGITTLSSRPRLYRPYRPPAAPRSHQPGIGCARRAPDSHLP